MHLVPIFVQRAAKGKAAVKKRVRPLQAPVKCSRAAGRRKLDDGGKRLEREFTKQVVRYKICHDRSILSHFNHTHYTTFFAPREGGRFSIPAKKAARLFSFWAGWRRNAPRPGHICRAARPPRDRVWPAFRGARPRRVKERKLFARFVRREQRSGGHGDHADRLPGLPVPRNQRKGGPR